ncbi:two-component response regulator [Lachnospiraceae bacterium TWA4]|nr:two-component response regulator [Lachnospiraceae bacterium TWA4]
MVVKVAICDDEQESLERVKNELIRSADELEIEMKVHLYTDGRQVLDDAQNLDVLFLDIDMPMVSGLEVARTLRENGSEVILIFISAHEQYVFESIEYQPFRYIRKERIEVEVFHALKAAYRKVINLQSKYIVLKIDDCDMIIKMDEIMYFETSLRKMEVHLKKWRNIDY